MKYLFIATWIALTIFLISQGINNNTFELHPFLGGLFQLPLNLPFIVVVIFRLLFIAISTYLSYLISVSHFEIARKDYTLAMLMPALHFCITDWNTGLIVSFYWLSFIGMIFLLFPDNFSAPNLRRIMSAALLAGLFLPNGPFALLLFVAGIVILIVWQNISFRTTLIWITGFLLPSLYLIFYYFLTDRLSLITNNAGNFFDPDNFITFKYNILQYAIPVAFLVLVVPVHARLIEYKILVRRSYSAFLLSIITLIPAFLYSGVDSLLFLAIIGFASVFYWNKTLYSVRRRGVFIIWLVLPFLVPVMLILIEMQIIVLPAL